jgi:beta-glucuronidase
MKRIALIVSLLAQVAFAQPGPDNLIANISGRTTISLDGTWNAIVDPYETGMRARFYENATPKDKSDLVEYNFGAAGTLKVPGDWNTQRDSLMFYENPLWYQRYFSYHRRPHTRTFVYFGAAHYHCRAWLNGKKLGEHTGGFTAFNFEVTDSLNEGDNSLVVEVNNARQADGVPGLDSDWWNYGGLTRSVELVEVPETFVQAYFVQLVKGSLNEIAGWVRLNNASQAQSVSLEIPEINFKKSLTTDAQGYAEFRFPAQLKLWSPDEPKLYQVLIATNRDKVEDQIGFRTIETRGTQILLNGKPIFLRGISMHEEAPFRDGRSYSEEDGATLLGWAKELGCNFIRLAHYPHNETFIRLADRKGLLVWSEVPVYWHIAWDNPATLENAEAQLRDMVARDHNRAAVIFWSLSNETPLEPGRLEFIGKMAAYARTLDSTRLITSAMNHSDKPDANTRLMNDPLGEVLDVLGWNEYLGWYEGRPEDADHITWKTSYEKPLIMSEFGGGALYGKHGDEQTRFTEEYQAGLYRHQLPSLSKTPSLAGMSPWVLMDFRSPRRFLAGVQDFHNRKGLISDKGQRKQAFYVLQKFYSEAKQRANQ